MSEVNEFLKELNGSDPINNQDPFSEIEGEEPKKDEQESGKSSEEDDDEPLPFHKDPKVQRYIEKQLEKKLKDIKPVEVTKEVTPESDEVVDVLTRIIGNDTQEKLSAIKDFRKALSGLEEKAVEKALGKIKSEREALLSEEREAETELENGLAEIEDNYNIDITSNTAQAKKTRNDFLNFVKRVAPKVNGEIASYPDFNETFSLFQEMNKKTNPVTSKAKDLADRSMSKSTQTTTMPKTENVSWNTIDKIFSSFKN